MPKRSKSSQRWLNRQRRDYFAKKAVAEGQVSRAHYKLDELDDRFGLVKSGSYVLELGAAPGGWTQHLARRAPRGRIIAVDPLPVSAGSNVEVVTGLWGEADIEARSSRCWAIRS